MPVTRSDTCRETCAARRVCMCKAMVVIVAFAAVGAVALGLYLWLR